MGFRGDITDYENCNMYLLIQKIQDHSTATVWTVLYLERSYMHPGMLYMYMYRAACTLYKRLGRAHTSSLFGTSFSSRPGRIPPLQPAGPFRVCIPS